MTRDEIDLARLARNKQHRGTEELLRQQFGFHLPGRERGTERDTEC
eukprot:SAG31_NODE_3185_length_4579_cov_2.704911_5_plen_46_part_00